MSNTTLPTLSILSHKNKTSALSNSINRLEEEVCVHSLTNKESVYGLFLDQLMHYYKGLPLELDFGFLKSIRKLHSRRNDLTSEERLQRAAEILIEAKNKPIKEQIDNYASECEQYRQKCPNVLTIAPPPIKKPKNKTRTLTSGTVPTQRFNKVLPPSKFFERVKSEGRDQNLNYSQNQKRSSFLLHPKSIRFQSRDSEGKVRVSTEGHDCRLPKIVQSNRALQQGIRSTIMRHKHVRVFFSPINRPIPPDKGSLLKSILFSSQNSHQMSTEEPVPLPKRNRGEVNLQLQLPKRQEQPRRNRKLMLQLLRQKNKQALVNE